MMMPKMVVMVVVVMVMVIAVLLMVARRVRAMNRVGSVGGSQRQRVHPLYRDGRGERGSCNTSEAEGRSGFTRASGESRVCGWPTVRVYSSTARFSNCGETGRLSLRDVSFIGKSQGSKKHELTLSEKAPCFEHL